jgi:hypothetical protein
MFSVQIQKTGGRFQVGIRAKNVQKTSKVQNKIGASFLHICQQSQILEILTWL